MKALQRLILAALLCMAGLHTQAAPFFASKDGSLIWDQATNLVWQRCSVGQAWDGNTCTGKAQEFDFEYAKKQTGNDWRMPTIRELVSLIHCSSGQISEQTDLKDGGHLIANSCAGIYSTPTITTVAFPLNPGYFFWSSSLYENNSGFAWSVSFGDGIVLNNSRYNSYHVRLVSAPQKVNWY